LLTNKAALACRFFLQETHFTAQLLASDVPNPGREPRSHSRSTGMLRRTSRRTLSYSMRQKSVKPRASVLGSRPRDQTRPVFMVGILAATSRTSMRFPSSDHG